MGAVGRNSASPAEHGGMRSSRRTDLRVMILAALILILILPSSDTAIDAEVRSSDTAVRTAVVNESDAPSYMTSQTHTHEDSSPELHVLTTQFRTAIHRSDPVPFQPPNSGNALQENSPSGAIAAAELVIAAYNHLHATGDANPWLNLSHPGCLSCVETAQRGQRPYRDGGHLVGGRIEIIDFHISEPTHGFPYYAVYAQAYVGSQVVIGPGDLLIEWHEAAMLPNFIMGLEFVAPGHWLHRGWVMDLP